MAVLSRVHFVAQQRIDLNHVLAQESFLANDFRSLITGLSGLTQPYILRGFIKSGQTGLSISISTSDSLVFNPLDNNGSFYLGLPDDPDTILTLPADQANVFVQAVFTNITTAPITTAFWDALALTGDSVAGTEFSASTNSQNVLQLEIQVNTVGFGPDAIPILRATTSASSVIAVTDARYLFYRLGIGGPTPDPLHKFPWANTRAEPVPSGTGSGEASDSPFQSSDASGIRNDKGLKSLKDWMDAVMTRIAEIAGQAIWYENGASSSAIGDLTLNTLFFDTIGHSIQPDTNATLKWVRPGAGLVLASGGTDPVAWQSNYSTLGWTLGGTFVNNVAGGSRAYSSVNFQSGIPVNDGNVYLLLEREVPKGSGANLIWQSNTADANLDATKSISGVAGDFTGIAVGDFIRKESEGFQRYYKVARVSDGTTITNTAGFVSGASIVAVEVSTTIIGIPSVEPLRYFRAAYDNSDVVVDNVVGQYPNQSIEFYWLGRRLGNLFILKGYGNLQEGEEVPVLDDAFTPGANPGQLSLQHGFGARYDASLGYETASGTLLSIYRRLDDNTVATPSSGDNSGAYLTYTLAGPVGLMTAGDTLWVNLGASGALVSGNVQTTPNTWQILPATATPLRTYANRNVFPVARRLVTTGPLDTQILVFNNGTVLSQHGQLINNDLGVSGDLYLVQPQTSVLFIDSFTPDKVTNDVTKLFYDNASGTFGVRNYRITDNQIDIATPANQAYLPSLGQHTLDIGSSNSTIRIPGNLTVLGAITATSRTTIQSDDALITLGVGNLLNSSGGSGIQVADNTQQTTTAAAVNGQPTLTLTYAAPHGYILGASVGVSGNTDVGGITTGQINGEYVVVALAILAGQAEIVSATQLKIYTSVNALSTATVTFAPPTTQLRTFDLPSSITLTDSSSQTTGQTSWSFKTKGVNPVTLTPVAGYTVAPTLNASLAVAGRIMFSGVDASGPGGTTTTIDEDGALFWDNGQKFLGIGTTTPDHALTIAGAQPAIIQTINSNASSFAEWQTQVGGSAARLVYTGATFGDATFGTNTLTIHAEYTAGDVRIYPGQDPTKISIFTSSGNVGIGTTTPAALLSIGTNTTTAAGGIQFGTDTDLYRNAANSLKTDGAFTAASFAITGGTQGSVLFLNSTGTVTEDNSKFYWDDTNFRLGVGKIPSAFSLDVQATSNSGIAVRNNSATEVCSAVHFNDIGNYTLTNMTGSTFSSGIQTADTGVFGTVGTGGLLLVSFDASGPLRFAAAGAEVARFDVTGKLGIGVTAPGQLFDVAGKFQVDSNGNILKLRNVTTSFPASQGAANTVLSNDGSGNLSWATPLLGGLYLNYATTKTSTYTIGTTETVIPVDTTGGSFSVNLPASTFLNKGQMVVIKDVGNFVATNAYTLVPDGADTIDGTNASIVVNFANGTALQLISNGSGGWILV